MSAVSCGGLVRVHARRSARRAGAAPGSIASARAISRRRWSPYGQVLGQLVALALAGRPASGARRPRTRDDDLLAAVPRRREQRVDPGWRLSRECIPTRTFSSAVMFGNRRMFWNVRPSPATTMSLGRALRKIPNRARKPLVPARAAATPSHERDQSSTSDGREDAEDDRSPRGRAGEPRMAVRMRDDPRRRRATATGSSQARPGWAIIVRPAERRSGPPSGRRCPAMMLKNVVLPAPFGPMRLTMLPRGIVKSMLLTATQAAEALGDLLGAEDRRPSSIASRDALGRRPRRTAPRRRASRPCAPTTAGSSSPSVVASSSATCSSRSPASGSGRGPRVGTASSGPGRCRRGGTGSSRKLMSLRIGMLERRRRTC